ALDAEENVAVRRRRMEHHRGLLPGAKRVLIDDDLKAAVAIAQLGRRVRRHPHGGLRFDRRGALVGAAPRDAVITFALRREAELGLALGVGLDGLREDVIALIAANLEPPPGAASRSWRRKRALFAQLLQLGAFHLTAARIEPDFIPGIACDFDGSLDLHR